LFFNFQLRAHVGPECSLFVSKPCFLCILPHRLMDFKPHVSTILPHGQREVFAAKHPAWPVRNGSYSSSPGAGSRKRSGSHGFSASAKRSTAWPSSFRPSPSRVSPLPANAAIWCGFRSSARSRSGNAAA